MSNRLILIGFIAAAIFFAFQLIMALKTKKIALKLLPVYICSAFLLFALGFMLGASIAETSVISGTLTAAVVFIAAGTSSIGTATAWAVCGVLKLTKNI